MTWSGIHPLLTFSSFTSCTSRPSNSKFFAAVALLSPNAGSALVFCAKEKAVSGALNASHTKSASQDITQLPVDVKSLLSRYSTAKVW